MIHAFIYGVILAFSLILPLGVQNIFVFNQGALQRHFLHALPSVLTATICDTVLIVLAVLGVSVIVLSLAWLKIVIFIIGAIFLLYMGWLTWNAKPTRLETNTPPFTDMQQVRFAVSVSLLNPHAILDTIGVIGTNSLHFTGNDKFAYTFACILVSFCWFFGLAIAGHFVHRIDRTGNWLLRINKLSAIIIWCVALYIIWQLLQMIMNK